ncbi:hypothetical protein AA958_03725 [Streptomyces sp. CNQ-509]|uniref:hypothetical protein n=1 Tax=Streptomyces sp. CNQ-509 TaxID=444103 RepID=UPI00062DCCD6|nr:hypothetical protein [Streptomyces sp. CNQ-509]AKH81445.1 hypothetical protein AA958_03725 [Streptomyces sp. CNQ-509]
MIPWYRQLWHFVTSREGFGAITVATSFGVAVGVVPSILQELSGDLWVFVVVFVAAVAAVVGGWALGRPRGVGVVACLYPQPDRDRLRRLEDASDGNHSSSQRLHPDLLSLGGVTLDPAARVDLAAKLISARIAEHQANDPDGSVTLYPLAPLDDGYLLGRRLRDTRFHALHVMHVPSVGSEKAVHTITLGPHLEDPLTEAQHRLVSRHMVTPAGTATSAPAPVANPDCPARYRHRLALIVRITPSTSMVADARFVATTGEVQRSADHPHTGYVPSDSHPCGAHAVIEAAGPLTESREVFEAVSAHIHQSWQTARATWAEETGQPGITTRLFISAPLPIVLALGWLLAREDVTLVPHRLHLSERGGT